ncbi:HNH endonuclease [Cupriavidus taiwanensis]|uniref:HNH endonuclease n=1 Tax=Cupriavidus taiwanensis TaxID=164546 RepID=UPI000E107C9B|nr:HNH endonuclease [Cupriavidus taiwanensis]SOY56835.1 HNH endonuclease domain protein [Cupriavidus taiwanensis]SOY90753.1 HNH endonuclease domain protein [Cupriavidus taiwanensis]SOZ63542.1 HNH endonuclease domain protein [Cupriavidus taiwanensis]SOZ82571.1 HNH endonuclease domain protein [Cupriavidus taiwanensis]SOZ84427.1 HNH endonuclease domain protein [Cupriavidus taiwanensis]
MAATKRKPISKKLRFEVFKRDSFKCQYCGKCAPDVILEVDHIDPVANGGDNDVMNLITSCVDCNAGKSDRLLSDDSVVAKQRQQLAELNERREQLEMMLKWRDGLKAIDETSLAAIQDAWGEAVPGFHLNDSGLRQARTHLKKYGLAAILDAIGTAGAQYIKTDSDGKVTRESAGLAWEKVAGILRMSQQPDYMRDLFYARGILRNRISYCDERHCIELMKDAVARGVQVEAIKDLARSVRNWTEFKNEIADLSWD